MRRYCYRDASAIPTNVCCKDMKGTIEVLYAYMAHFRNYEVLQECNFFHLGTCSPPPLILLQLPLKSPYKNLKRKSLEKKISFYVCFVLRFLKVLFYALKSFVLLCGGPM